MNNGLNQVTVADGAAVTWDTSGNLANDGTRAYSYDAADRLTQAGSTGMTYDAFDRMSQLSTVRFGWVGTEVVSEHDTSNVLTRRNVPGPWQDEVAAYYLDETTTGRRWPLTDQLGSVVSYSRPDGTLGSINAYDEYGVGAAGNTGRFGYTGQMNFASIGLSYYKARFYNPELGRFLQTDPIGYGGGANLYAYVGGDPVNFTDPFGLTEEPTNPGDTEWVYDGCRLGWTCYDDVSLVGDVFVVGPRIQKTGGGGRRTPWRPRLPWGDLNRCPGARDVYESPESQAAFARARARMQANRGSNPLGEEGYLAGVDRYGRVGVNESIPRSPHDRQFAVKPSDVEDMRRRGYTNIVLVHFHPSNGSLSSDDYG